MQDSSWLSHIDEVSGNKLWAANKDTRKSFFKLRSILDKVVCAILCADELKSPIHVVEHLIIDPLNKRTLFRGYTLVVCKKGH